MAAVVLICTIISFGSKHKIHELFDLLVTGHKSFFFEPARRVFIT